MFLVELNERERKTFLELAYHAMSSDGEIAVEEEEVFRSYAYECEMPEYQFQGTEIATLTTSTKAYTKRKRRIMLIELWGIILSDGEIGEKEAEWMEKVAKDMELSSGQSRRIRRWAQDFVDIIGDGYRLLEGE